MSQTRIITCIVVSTSPDLLLSITVIPLGIANPLTNFHIVSLKETN